MPPNKPQSNYSKRPVRKVRLLKIGPRNTKSLFEEYFYAFVVSICVAVAILGKAGGLSGYDAIVTGLWAGGFTWFAGQLRRYRKEGARPAQRSVRPAREARKPAQTPAPAGQAPGAPSNPSKPAFVYERPTLPDRKPKLPNNWPGRADKKPKR